MAAVYFMISATHTRFARLIRRFGGTRYNHASIALDPELKELYAFARPNKNAVFLAHLIHEQLFYYSRGKYPCINVVIFKIDVSQEQYDEIRNIIHEVQEDREYVYNLFSVLTYPVTRGFGVHKAFSCIEFAIYLLVKLGICPAGELYRYKPDDLLRILEPYVWYTGNLLEYTGESGQPDPAYIAPLSLKLWLRSMIALQTVVWRSLFFREQDPCVPPPDLHGLEPGVDANA